MSNIIFLIYPEHILITQLLACNLYNTSLISIKSLVLAL